MEAPIATLVEPVRERAALLTTIPGVSDRTAQALVEESEFEMHRSARPGP